jgi:hypothetical protein
MQEIETPDRPFPSTHELSRCVTAAKLLPISLRKVGMAADGRTLDVTLV